MQHRRRPPQVLRRCRQTPQSHRPSEPGRVLPPALILVVEPSRPNQCHRQRCTPSSQRSTILPVDSLFLGAYSLQKATVSPAPPQHNNRTASICFPSCERSPTSPCRSSHSGMRYGCGIALLPHRIATASRQGFRSTAQEKVLTAEILPIHSTEPEPDLIAYVVKSLASGGVAALPTDTFYGLAVDPVNLRAVDRIYEIKTRARHKPLSLLIAETAQAYELAREIDTAFDRLAERFWPGPLTIVVKASAHGFPARHRPTPATSPLRVPEAAIDAPWSPASLSPHHSHLRQPAGRHASGVHRRPLRLAQSARSDLRSPSSSTAALPTAPAPVPTTIVDLSGGGNSWMILREGAIPTHEIALHPPSTRAAENTNKVRAKLGVSGSIAQGEADNAQATHGILSSCCRSSSSSVPTRRRCTITPVLSRSWAKSPSPSPCSASMQDPFDCAVALLHSFAYTAAAHAFQDVATADPAMCHRALGNRHDLLPPTLGAAASRRRNSHRAEGTRDRAPTQRQVRARAPVHRCPRPHLPRRRHHSLPHPRIQLRARDEPHRLSQPPRHRIANLLRSRAPRR